MPTTENDRRNLQQPVLEKPALPDHDRTQDEGMHRAIPDEFRERSEDTGSMEDEQLAPPDQEFGQVLQSGHSANQGRIPEDPNNALTSDKGGEYDEQDPEDRGESLPDYLERDKH